MNNTSLRYWIVLPLALLLAGCTQAYYRKSADKAAYRAINQKSVLVPNMDPQFTIERTNQLSLDGYPVSSNVLDALGPYGERERGARLLRLEDALALAVGFSREYQSQKETLFLNALDTTLVRHQFTPTLKGSASSEFTGVNMEHYITNGAGSNQSIALALVQEDKLHNTAGVSAEWLMRDVGKLTAAFTTDFLRFVSGSGDSSRSSELSFEFARPLWRDAGYKRQMEALTQAERSMLYKVREFTRYRRDFSVSIAESYFGVLRNRDAVRNNFLNLQSSRKNAEQIRALAQEGRKPQSDLGRLAQQELSAESTWINSVRTYRQSLDNFKILLGLTVDENIILDDAELAALRIEHPDISVEDSIEVALGARLDYFNSKDALADADRHVKLAVNFLKPRVDLDSQVRFKSSPDQVNGVPIPDFSRYSYSAGLTLDPVFDRTAERDDYRSKLIQRDQAARAVDQKTDEIKLQVRDNWRSLEQAKRDFEISEIGVQIAERRVEEQTIRAELGIAYAQDQVDAQNALADSKNGRTQALVTHTIARLKFWNNLGILYIKNQGQWEVVKK